MAITVHGTEDAVLAALEEELSPEEFASLRLDSAQDAASGSPFSPAPRRAEPITTATVVIWVVSGVAGGLGYDLAKQLMRKVKELLLRKFGPGSVTGDADE
jgi:hypothetical protein